MAQRLRTVCLSLVAVVALVSLAAWWYPLLPRASDEVNYIATALKMGREYRLTAATHLPEDILEHGTEHRHVKMPAYLISLALWMKAVPDPDDVRLLNLTLFAGATVLLFWYVVGGRAGQRVESTLCAAVLLAAPLDLAYANTAMMESFVLFVVTLHFLCWFAPWVDGGKLPLFYLTAFLVFVTKEVFLLLSVAIVAVHWREFVARHRALLRASRARFIGLALLVAALAAISWSLYANRGYFPSFRNHLFQAPDVATALDLIGAKASGNLRAFGSWARFPHDYLYGYMLAYVALTVVMTYATRGTPDCRAFSTIVVGWTLSLAAICVLYDNLDWKSHRINGVYATLATAVVMKWVLDRLAVRWQRVAIVAALLAVNVPLCMAVNERFIVRRGLRPREPHPLTQMHLAQPGDCLLSPNDVQFLAENPQCELIWGFPSDPRRGRAVIERARPRFALLPAEVDLKPWGYEVLAPLERAASGGSGHERGRWLLWELRDEPSAAE